MSASVILVINTRSIRLLLHQERDMAEGGRGSWHTCTLAAHPQTWHTLDPSEPLLLLLLLLLPAPLAFSLHTTPQRLGLSLLHPRCRRSGILPARPIYAHAIHITHQVGRFDVSLLLLKSRLLLVLFLFAQRRERWMVRQGTQDGGLLGQ